MDFVDDDVGDASKTAFQLPKEYADGAEEGGSVRAREPRFETDGIARRLAQLFAPLFRHALGDGNGRNTTRLGDDDVTIGATAWKDADNRVEKCIING